MLAEEKLGEKEFGKYMTHLDEQEKILCLVLNLTKRLSATECSIRALPKDTCHEERVGISCSDLIIIIEDCYSGGRLRHWCYGFLTFLLVTEVSKNNCEGTICENQMLR